MNRTIKQHLAVIREALAFYATDEQPEGWHAIDALQHLAAIEAKLDAPMKSAEEWTSNISLQQIVSSIQQDAIASKLPDVDVDDFINQVMDDEELVIEIMEDAQRMFREWDRKRGPTQVIKPQDSSDYWCVVAAMKRSALLKARGGV